MLNRGRARDASACAKSDRGRTRRRASRLRAPTLSLLVLCVSLALALVTESAAVGQGSGNAPGNSAASPPPGPSPEARAASRTAYRNQSDADAIATGRRKFPDFVGGPPFIWPPKHAHQHVVGYINDRTAIVSTDGSDTQGVLDSSVPLEGTTPAGDRAPIDLDLVEHGGALVPKSASTPVRIGKDGPGEIHFPDEAFGVDVAGAASQPANVVDDKAFFANALADTDVLLQPKSDGGELSVVLRSPAAPTTLPLSFHLKGGQELRMADGPGPLQSRPAEVVDHGHRVAAIDPAMAVDAGGDEVPVTYRIDGDRLMMSIDTSDDPEYPILVDPVIGVYDYYGGTQNPGPGGYTWPGWDVWTNGQPYIHSCTSYSAPFIFCNNNGKIWVSGEPGYNYNPSDYAQWRRWPRPNSYIYQVDAWGLSNHPETQMAIGVWRHDGGGWEAGTVTRGNATTSTNHSNGAAGCACAAYKTNSGESLSETTYHLYVHSNLVGDPTPSTAITTGNRAVLRLYTYPFGVASGVPNQPWTQMESAGVYMSELSAPTLASPTHTKSGWFAGSDTVSATATDVGLGMGNVALYKGSTFVNRQTGCFKDTSGNCTSRLCTQNGTGGSPAENGAGAADYYDDPTAYWDDPNNPYDPNNNKSGCTLRLDSSLNYTPPEGISTYSLQATDLVGNHDPAQDKTWQVKVDNTAPTFSSTTGTLTTTSGWTNDPNPSLTVNSQDVGPNNGPSSGVATDTIQIDNTPKPTGPTATQTNKQSNGADCNAQSGCASTLSHSYTWANAPDGEHSVKVTAQDAAGNQASKPAAGEASWLVHLDHTRPDLSEPSGSGYQPGGVVDSSPKSVTVDATDGNAGIKKVELLVGEQVVDEKDPDCTGGCKLSFHDTLTWNPGDQEGPRNLKVRVTDAADATSSVGNQATREWTETVDHTPPKLTFAGSAALPVATGHDLTLKGDDGSGSGVQKFELWLDKDPSTAAPDHVKTYQCSPACNGHEEDSDWSLPTDLTPGKHTIRARVTDAAGLSDLEETVVNVVDLFPGSRDRLGLEHYFQYDDTDAGGGSKVYVNAETGNAVWHSVPIVNKGRGLSTVVNLTYNSQDRGGLLGDTLGRVPILDRQGGELWNLASHNPASTLIPGLSYSEAGVGFSIGVSGPTRLNEPLGGVLLAQVAEEPQTGGVIDGLNEVLPQLPDPTITMTDADGTEHTFTRQNGQWVASPGLDMHLRMFHTGGSVLSPDPHKWAMTRPDGVTHFFDNLGYLTETRDRNGNSLNYHYEYYDAYTGQATETLKDASGNNIDVNVCHDVEAHKAALGVEFELDADPNNPSDKLAAVQRVYCAKRVDKVTDAGGRDLKIDYQHQPLIQHRVSANAGVRPLDTPQMPAVWYGLVGGSSGRIDKITDHAGRQYQFEYDNGYLSNFIEASGENDARETHLYYEDWQGLQGVGQDRQLAKVTEVNANGNDGKSTDIRYADRVDRLLARPLQGTPLDPREACGVTKRNGGGLATQPPQPQQGQICRSRANNLETTYDYTPRTDTQPRRFDVHDVLERASSAADQPTRSATTTSELDGQGRPTKVTDPLGTQTKLTWNNDNELTSVEDAACSGDAAYTHLGYDEANGTGALLTESKYPDYQDTAAGCSNGDQPHLGDPLTTTFDYQFGNGTEHANTNSDDNGKFVADLTAIHKPRAGTGSSFGLDANGNVTDRYDHPDRTGVDQKTTYNADGTIDTEQDGVPGDHVTTYQAYDPTGQPTKVEDPRLKLWKYSYDKAGNLTHATDPRGSSNDNIDDNSPYTTTLTYDNFDRVTNERIPKLSAGSDDNEKFRTVSRSYDRNGNVMDSTDGAGKKTTVTYSPMDQPQEVDRPGGSGSSPRTEITKYLYDDADRLVARFDPKGSAAAPSSLPSTVLAECGNGQQPSPSAYMTHYCLDDAGRRTAEVRTAPGEDPNALITSYAFDRRDNETGMSDPVRNKGESITDAVSHAGDPSMARFHYTYDKVDRRTDQEEFPSNGAVHYDGPGLKTHYHYDANGNQDEVLPPRAFDNSSAGDDSFATKSFYDDRDLLVARRTPAGCTDYFHREDGKVTAVTTPRGTEGAAENCHDSEPQDANGHAQPFKYFTTRYTFDDAGNVTSRAIPYAKDQYGRDDAEFAGWKVTYGRDDVGNPTTITDARGHSFNNTFYDTGELHTTGRPSWYQLDWGQQSDYDVADPARHFTDSGSGADLEIRDGGPDLTETDGRSRNGEHSADDPKLPDTSETGNFGKVDPQDPGDQLPDAGATTFSYDGEMRLTGVKDAAGNDSTIGYDDAGRVSKKTWPFKDGAPIEHDYTYDPDGNLQTYTDGRGNQTTFGNDGYDRRSSETTPGAASGPGNGFDSEQTKYGYDPNGNLTSRQTPRGADYTFEFKYDNFDRLKSETNPAGETWSYGYDSNGNVAHEHSPRAADPGSYQTSDFQTTFGYDKADRLTSSKPGYVPDGYSADDMKTTYGYDADGNQTSVESPGSAGDDGGSVSRRLKTTEYDGRDLPWRETTSTTVPDRQRTTIKEYDPNGNLERVVNGRGINGDRLPIVANPPGTSTDDATWHATLRQYNNDDQLTHVLLPWSKPSASDGGSDETTNPSGPSDGELLGDDRHFVQDFERGDSLQRVTAIDSPHEQGHSAPRTTYTYFNNRWIKTQSQEKVVSAGDQPQQEALVTYDYNPEGEQTMWRTQHSDVDSRGRLIRRTFYDDGTLRRRVGSEPDPSGDGQVTLTHDYFYDPNRSLARFDTNDGHTTNVTRDSAERETVVNEAWSGGRDTTFSYDLNGNVHVRRVDGHVDSSASPPYGGDEAKSTTFDYDPLDRETQMVVNPAGDSNRTTTTTWWPSGEMKTRTKPNQTVESYFYNPRGQITEKQRDPVEGATETQSYTYDADQNRLTDERGKHVFDARGQLRRWTRSSDYDQGTGIASTGKAGTTVTYDRNGSGDITKKVDDLPLLQGGTTTTNFVYDGERLRYSDTSRAVDGAGTRSDYSYDDFGSVVKVADHTHGAVSLPNPPSGPAPPTTCDQLPDDPTATTTHYCFDEFERMIAARGGNVDKPSNITYDGLDRRDHETVDDNGATKTHDLSYVGTSRLLSREIADNGDKNTYDYDSEGRRLGQSVKAHDKTSPDYRSYATDANGSVTGLENHQGQQGDNNADTYLYDPYGNKENVAKGPGDAGPDAGLSDNAKANPFRFEGFYFDSGVATYDMQARQYRPDVGRFLSQDRFEEAAGDQFLQADPLTQNRYAFAGGNPVNNVEFDGHEPASSYTMCNHYYHNCLGRNAPSRNNGSGGNSGASSQRPGGSTSSRGTTAARSRGRYQPLAFANLESATAGSHLAPALSFPQIPELTSLMFPGPEAVDPAPAPPKEEGDFLDAWGGTYKGLLGVGWGNTNTRAYEGGKAFGSSPATQIGSVLADPELLATKGSSAARWAFRLLRGGGRETAEGASEGLRALTSRNFRENLARHTGEIPPGAQAHHIFPQKFAQQFEERGININDPRYGAWWEAGAHQQASAAYNREWEGFLRLNPSSDQVLDFGREISKAYGLHPNF